MLQSLIRSVHHAATATTVAFSAARTCTLSVNSYSRRYLSAQPPKTTKRVEMVMLLDAHGKPLGDHSIETAEALAKKMRMALVPLEEDAGGKKRKTFQMLPFNDPKLSGVVKTKKAEIEVKLMQMSTNVADHDLRTKAKQIKNWISKNTEVRVSFIGHADTTESHLESLFSRFESCMADDIPYRCVQKTVKAGSLRLVLMPPKKKNVPNSNKTRSDNVEANANDVNNQPPSSSPPPTTTAATQS